MRLMALVQFLRYQVLLLQRLGFLSFARYRTARKMDPVLLRVGRTKIHVRRGTPDLAVAMDSLGGEFDELGDLIGEAFSGLIIDAGAYIGSASLALNKIFPRAHIVALEPDPENFQVLQKNVGQVPEITPIAAALVGKETGRIKLFDRHTGKWGLTLVQRPADSENPTAMSEVETLSLKRLIAKWGNPAVLKLDIEGGEHEIFSNAPELCVQIPVILAELHDSIVPGCEKLFRGLSADRTVKRDAREKLLSYDERLLNRISF